MLPFSEQAALTYCAHSILVETLCCAALPSNNVHPLTRVRGRVTSFTIKIVSNRLTEG
ncbi:hypothetical protein DFR28_102792 [Arenicella xantha]|uniref:Uncharacterized protein n=1 Tax=Arenicella xantha TaxID=644221 RepID=A0A395JKS6_9GAMM|nr:hypothetical protein DFR28_102792 [Arenicella xantha]